MSPGAVTLFLLACAAAGVCIAAERRGAASLPVLPPGVPKRNGLVSRALGRAVVGLLGWRVEGNVPDVRKCVLVVAPHTSNWDLPVGIALMLAIDLRVNWFGKHTIFWFPLDRLLNWLGGIPIDRSVPGGTVTQVVDHMRAAPMMFLGLAPEGTRRPVERWKTGFYHVAEQARVPIVPVAFDYPRTTVVVFPPFEPTGNLEGDVAHLQGRFHKSMARHPERYAQ